jgi:hypothetical protein
LVGHCRRVVEDKDNHIPLHRNLLSVFSLSSRVDHDALGRHVLTVLLLHVHVLHILKISRVHLGHHIVHLVMLVERSHVVSIVKLGLRELRIHELGHIWIHEHLGHWHAHLLILLVEMTLILVLVVVLIVEALAHCRVVVHSHVIEHLLLLLMLHEERICWER